MRFDTIIENATVVTVSSQGTIPHGGIAISQGKFSVVGPMNRIAGLSAELKIDAGEQVVCPGLVDCHTHLMEFAAQGVHNASRGGQMMAGVANLFTARQAGTVATGEHHLGHPLFSEPTSKYKEVGNTFPGTARVCAGFCIIGTNRLVVSLSIRPGQALQIEDLLESTEITELAKLSDFPGESLFLTATVANLPFELVPRGGEVCFSHEQVRFFVNLFHDEGKKVGAHIEGIKAINQFLDAGGDVIHHGHGLTGELARRMARQKVALVATPHGGTSSRPNSPEDIAIAFQAGVRVAIASDAYLPKHPEATWFEEPPGFVYGPHHLMHLSHPAMKHLKKLGYEENELLALITKNGAEILGVSEELGSIEEGKQATFLITKGVPGLDVTKPEDISAVYIKGRPFVSRAVTVCRISS